MVLDAEVGPILVSLLTALFRVRAAHAWDRSCKDVEGDSNSQLYSFLLLVSVCGFL